MEKKELLDGLKDIGASKEFLEAFENASCKEKYKMINDYRASLLDEIKMCNKRIEIIDYLLTYMKEACNK